MEDVGQMDKTIENMGVLELINMKPEDLARISLIQNIGVILVSEAMSGVLMNITQRNIGMIVTIPQTSGKIKVLTGQLSLSGDIFSNSSGSSEDILVIAGQTIITSSLVEKIGYKDIIIAGQLIAPKGMESLLTSAVTRMSGQIAYYTSDTPRIFIGEDTFSKAFFDLIEGKMGMLLVGRFEIDSDVDIATLKQKVSEIILIGELSAPKTLVPLLQLLAVVKLGAINGRDAALTNQQ